MKLFVMFCFADAPTDTSGKDASLKIWMVPIYVSKLAVLPKDSLDKFGNDKNNFQKYSNILK